MQVDQIKDKGGVFKFIYFGGVHLILDEGSTYIMKKAQ